MCIIPICSSDCNEEKGRSDASGGLSRKNRVFFVNFAKKAFTFAAVSCKIIVSFPGRTSFFWQIEAFV